MACRLDAFCIDAVDPTGLARFWAGLLGGDPGPDPSGGAELWPSEEIGFALRFAQITGPEARLRTASTSRPNQYHLDLTSSTADDQQHTVERALRLGARHLDIGQGPDVLHIVLADPEGNAFCVIEPDNGFLADCGFVGALVGDGSQQTGHFWSEALGWPLVWDQDQETAIRSPAGGPKITWGGSPLQPERGRASVRFDLAPQAGHDHRAEAERLTSLGATRVDIGQSEGSWVVLADPDGHEFRLLAG